MNFADFFLWAMQKYVNIVDLKNPEKCAYSRYLRRRYSRERAAQSFETPQELLGGGTSMLFDVSQFSTAYPTGLSR